jgi:ABC-type histidine transport system ATPase subunit
VSAPNSYGKTSITEALEFLLFGETSKVAHAQSKDEYRDSYRNSHWPADRAAYVEATTIESDGRSSTLRVELDPTGEVRRFVDEKSVAAWPFKNQADGAASPFILQHALKYLLLVPPNERFEGFARLLGLDDVDDLQRAIVSLCTKPEATIPANAKKALADLEGLESRIAGTAKLQGASRDLKKGTSGTAAAYEKFDARADTLLGKKVPPTERVARLVRMRDDLAAKIFSGSVAIRIQDQKTQTQLSSDEASLAASVSAAFLDDWGKLTGRGVADRLAREAKLLSIGVELIAESPGSCPLCGQALDDERRRDVHERDLTARTKAGIGSLTEEAQTRVDGVVKSLRSILTSHKRTLESGAAELLLAMNPANQAKVASLFGQPNQAAWDIVLSASSAIAPLQDALVAAADRLDGAITTCESATTNRREEATQVEVLGKAVNSYLESALTLRAKLEEMEPLLLGPARILRQAIDELAGTAELTLLIDVHEKKGAVDRAMKVRDVLNGLKDLKKAVEQTVGETMEAAFSADLTSSVMDWYGRIRTTGDPDVHFSGFAMDRTKGGDFKKGKVKISAQSYGVQLASAVSSLSESKLNALGLSVSIASALRAPGPWEFLVLDDPIQSWDAEHETQFVEVVRTLAEREKKQVVVLTHKSDWARQICMGCRTLNGQRYEITGYTKDGPQIQSVEWATLDQRFREVETIVKDAEASPVRLQQAEEEIRIICHQLASEIAASKLGRATSPHKMNAQDVRAILNEAGCEGVLVDEVVAMFGTVDPAHHAPKNYVPNVQRIRQYVATCRKLENFRGLSRPSLRIE